MNETAAPPALSTDARPGPIVEPQPQAYRFEFTATGAEYFRIWIVNVALTIITLGIYSAWAKVRNRQYFYGNARLAQSGFEYTANPVNILKGRLLVFSVFAVYQLAATFQPVLAGVLVLILLPLFPWMVVNAVRFNHRYSAYRNLRFRFEGTYAEAAKIYILWTLAIIFSFGLAYPFVAWRRKKFLVERSFYGDGQFSYHAEVGYFYLVYVLGGVCAGAAVTLLAIVMGGGIAVLGPDLSGNAEEILGADRNGTGATFLLFIGLLYLTFVLAFVVVNTAIQAAISNFVWSNSRLGDIRFKLRMNLFTVTLIQISNLAAIIASVGLLIPWAKVRMTRYRLSCFTMLSTPHHLDEFLATQRERVTATGNEFGEALDLDLGL